MSHRCSRIGEFGTEYRWIDLFVNGDFSDQKEILDNPKSLIGKVVEVEDEIISLTLGQGVKIID